MNVIGILWISNSSLTVTVKACVMLVSYVIYTHEIQFTIRNNIGEYKLKNLFIRSTSVWILISMNIHTSIYQTPKNLEKVEL